MIKPAIVIPVGVEPGISAFVPYVHACTRDLANIYFVTDRGTDRATLAALRYCTDDLDGCTVLETDQRGLAKAYRHGYLAAWGNGCTALLEMDVGHDPKQIPTFLGHIAAGAHFAPGVRWGVPYASYSKKNPFRWALSRGGSALIGHVVGDDRLSDWTSGYHAIDRRTLSAVIGATHWGVPPGRWWQTLVRITAMKYARNVQPVPIAYRPSGRVRVRDVLASARELVKLCR